MRDRVGIPHAVSGGNAMPAAFPWTRLLFCSTQMHEGALLSESGINEVTSLVPHIYRSLLCNLSMTEVEIRQRPRRLN